MKLTSYQWQGRAHVGLCLGSTLYSLSEGAGDPGCADMTDFLRQGEPALSRARAVEAAAGRGDAPSASCALTEAKLLPPVTGPEKIICIGRNYLEHAQETGADLPKEPLFFTKFASALAGARDPVVLPRVSQQVDYEAELAVVIGREGKYLGEDEALEYVAGYMILNDVSARDWQYRTGQFTAGKTFDTFASCGPHLVTRDEVPDPHDLAISLTLNGRVMQDSNTGKMIFRIPRLIAYLSQLFPLRPGDIISTGTPAGVGFSRKPPVFLQPGDSIRIEIERVGVLESTVEAE